MFQMKGLQMIVMDINGLSLWFSWFEYLFDKNLHFSLHSVSFFVPFGRFSQFRSLIYIYLILFFASDEGFK